MCSETHIISRNDRCRRPPPTILRKAFKARTRTLEFVANFLLSFSHRDMCQSAA